MTSIMRFLDLVIRGFCSFSTKPQRVKLSKRGLVLIEGENRDDPTVMNNGSGKSTIPLALLWCLYGKTGRSDLTGDYVINRRAKSKGAMVSVTLEDDRGETFTVTRYRGDPDFKNQLKLEPAPASFDTKETQERIIELIGMDFDAFTNSVIFGQDQLALFAAMTDKEQKLLLDRFVGIEALSAAHDSVAATLAETKRMLERLDAGLPDLSQLKDDLRAAVVEARSWKKTHAVRLQKAEKQAKSAPAAVDTSALVLTVRGLREALVDAEAAHVAASKTHMRALPAVGSARGELLAVERRVKKALAAQPGTCSECGQAVEEEHLRKVRTGLQHEYQQARENLASAEHAVTAAEATVREQAERVASARKALREEERVLDTAKAANALASSAASSVRALREEENPHRAAMKRARKRYRDAREAHAAAQQERAVLATKVKTLTFVAGMLSNRGADGAPPLKALIIDSVAPFLNRKLSAYARRLTDGNIDVTFETQSTLKSGETRDTYALRAVDKFGAEIYGGLSKGQRRKVDIAVFLAFKALASNRSTRRVNFACWDEVFDALDETAQEVMVELLLEEKTQQESLFVITQRPELQAFFPSVIRVVKRKGFTRVQ